MIEPAAEAAPGVAAPAPYLWARHWWPIIPLSYLHEDRPNAATALGNKLVLWKTPEGWSALQDRCPHRLAPLSEGRVDAASGTLMCSYHGWRFDGEGACQDIPQATSDKAGQAARLSRRSCVTSYPVKEVAGVLFAWLDASPAGLAESSKHEPYVPQEIYSDRFDWGCNDVPLDFARSFEQTMDPSHAMFLHHNKGFRMENAVGMEADMVTDIDLQRGYTWRHRGYEKKNAAMVAERTFVPPATIRVEYVMPNGSRTVYCIMALPVEPGVTRNFGNFALNPAPTSESITAESALGAKAVTPAAVGPAAAVAQGASTLAAAAASNGSTDALQPVASASASRNGASTASASSASNGVGSTAGSTISSSTGGTAAKTRSSGGNRMTQLLLLVFKSVPHYWGLDQSFNDQDIVIVHRQDTMMRSQGLPSSAFASMTPADQGVVALHKWLKMADFAGMWAQVHAPERPPVGITQTLPLDKLLDRHTRHVHLCKTCQKGIHVVTRICVAVAVACAACALRAVAVAWAQRTVLSLGAAPWAAGALLLGVVLQKLLWLRTDRFFSGVQHWQESGQYSIRNMK